MKKIDGYQVDCRVDGKIDPKTRGRDTTLSEVATAIREATATVDGMQIYFLSETRLHLFAGPKQLNIVATQEKMAALYCEVLPLFAAVHELYWRGSMTRKVAIFKMEQYSV